MASWNPRRLPPQTGKTFVVTGGNAGIGYFISEQLASAGAHVVLASRNAVKADAAMSSIRSRVPGASVGFVRLDLASLDSVRDAAAELLAFDHLDGLIENASVTPHGGGRQVTADGHELMFGTNHLGHFALTALVFPALARTSGSRIVTMGSGSTRMVRLRADDLQSERKYSAFAAYAQSKHATQAFGFELDRRLQASGNTGISILVAHPGSAQDGLSPFRASVNEPSLGDRLGATLLFVAGGSKAAGAWPAVRAAVDPDAAGGQYWGRTTPVWGQPAPNRPVASSHDPAFGRRLWELSEEWTGVRFPE